MKQSTGKGRRAWFWTGVILLAMGAMGLLLCLLADLEGGDEWAIALLLFVFPFVIPGIYCVWRGRKKPAVGMVRDNEPANLGDAKSVESLIRSLGHEDESVRRRAAEALGEIGDTRAMKPLTRALKDDNWVVQIFAKEALEKIKAKRA